LTGLAIGPCHTASHTRTPYPLFIYKKNIYNNLKKTLILFFGAFIIIIFFEFFFRNKKNGPPVKCISSEAKKLGGIPQKSSIPDF
jgi:hypothetical protein